MKGNRVRLHLPGLLVATLLATTLLSISLLSSCTEADVIGGGSGGEQPGGKTVEATFALQAMPGKAPVARSIAFTSRGSVVSDTLTVGASGSEPDCLQTRAGDSGTDQERTISNVWAGQYDATTGTLLSQNYVTPIVADSVVLTLVPSENCNIRFVANAGDLGAEGAPTATAIQTESGLQGLKLTTVTTGGKLQNDLCVMTGLCARHDVPATGFRKEEVAIVDLTRLPAKLTFQYTINTADGRFSFTPAEIRVENVPGLISQVGVPTGQLTPTQYTTFQLTTANTVECYLPENMAGNGDAVASLKDRIGAGVANATSIVLSGSAVQDGVSYSGVEIRFFPGDSDPAKLNNYDIERNGHYTMNITLGGLDFTDKRITIGTVPPIGPIPNLPAARGATQQVQVTARPGMEWVFDLPVWLSAKLPGTTTPTDSITVPAGSKLSYKGPVNVNFKVEESNPRAEERQVSFPILLGDQGGTTDQLILKQDGSTLTVVQGIPMVEIGATPGSTGTFSFMATAGLPWDALFSSDFFDWSGTPALGNETTGVEQPYTIAAKQANPSVTPRTGTVTVRVGASITDALYDGLKKTIQVKQLGSEVIPGDIVSLVATPASGTATFTATPGLPWTATTDAPWIEITTPAGEPTVEGTNANTIAFNTTQVNPYGTIRTANITVKAGGLADSPTGNINIQQQASEQSVTDPVDKIPQDMSSSVTGSITATDGLPWTISTADNFMKVAPTSGSGNAQLTFSATSVNPGAPRKATFTVTVTGTEPARTVEMEVTQEGIQNMVTIDQDMESRYNATGSPNRGYPPFNYDSGTLNSYGGPYPPNFVHNESSKLINPYSIEVSKNNISTTQYSYAISRCPSGWRIPTNIELFAMSKNKGQLQTVEGFAAFETSSTYWSSSVYGKNMNSRCTFDFNGIGYSNFSPVKDTKQHFVRCVRNLFAAQ